jgi:hypothetical protein
VAAPRGVVLVRVFVCGGEGGLGGVGVGGGWVGGFVGGWVGVGGGWVGGWVWVCGCVCLYCVYIHAYIYT